MADSLELQALERELEQLKRQLPAHSIPPSLLARMDELEERIAALHAPAPETETPGNTGK